MTLQEVADIMGSDGKGEDAYAKWGQQNWDTLNQTVREGFEEGFEGGFAENSVTKFWFGKTSSLTVVFDPDGRVCAKSMTLGRFPSLLERVREWLGW